MHPPRLHYYSGQFLQPLIVLQLSPRRRALKRQLPLCRAVGTTHSLMLSQRYCKNVSKTSLMFRHHQATYIVTSSLLESISSIRSEPDTSQPESSLKASYPACLRNGFLRNLVLGSFFFKIYRHITISIKIRNQ
jgi:hypothetical protein